MTLLSIVNFVIIIIILIIAFIMFFMEKTLSRKIDEINTNKTLVETEEKDNYIKNQYQLLYKKQFYNFRVEDYFLDDIYQRLIGPAKKTAVMNDYFGLLVKAIDAILNNKTDFQQNYNIYNKLEALKFPYYLPLAKYAKYTIDYDKYLRDFDPNQIFYRLNVYYPNFRTDEQYYIILKNKTCTQRAHVLLFLEKAVQLYIDYPDNVDQCIYYNICEQKPQTKQEQQCKLL